jgi:hypothetical protein
MLVGRWGQEKRPDLGLSGQILARAVTAPSQTNMYVKALSTLYISLNGHYTIETQPFVEYNSKLNAVRMTTGSKHPFLPV